MVPVSEFPVNLLAMTTEKQNNVVCISRCALVLTQPRTRGIDTRSQLELKRILNGQTFTADRARGLSNTAAWSGIYALQTMATVTTAGAEYKEYDEQRLLASSSSRMDSC